MATSLLMAYNMGLYGKVDHSANAEGQPGPGDDGYRAVQPFSKASSAVRSFFSAPLSNATLTELACPCPMLTYPRQHAHFDLAPADLAPWGAGIGSKRYYDTISPQGQRQG